MKIESLQPPLETGNPVEDGRGFRRALGHFATGVTIITAQVDGEPGGLTVNSFSSVSLDPPLIQWSLAKSAQSVALFEKASHFAVNVLASDQVELAGSFARSGGDKFAGLSWQPGLGDAPLFPGLAASFECTTWQKVDAGDHFIVLGRVERFSRTARPLLLFAQGRFGLAIDYPTPPGESGTQVPGANVQDTMLGLLWDAFSKLSHGFQIERDAAGMTINQGRVLSLIERHPGAPIDLLARKSFVSPPGVEEAIGALIELGYAARTTTGGCEVTPTGRERVLTLRRRALTFEAQQLAQFSAQDLETTRRVLQALGIPNA